MGLGPPVIALYHQLKTLGVFDDVKQVMELGSQNVWCPKIEMVQSLFKSFGRPDPTEQLTQSLGNWTASARDLYQELGFTYHCVDADGKFGALTLDINFDRVPPEHLGQYDFVTNHGTTEHVFNQFNAFKMIHDFTRAGGYMLHALPFLGQLDHGYFNYQPNLFHSLARYNAYRTLGIWLGIDWQLSSFVPWEPRLLEFLTLSPKSTGLLIVLQQKVYSNEFCVPFQGHYEDTVPDNVISRYRIVVDGEYYDGARARQVPLSTVRARHLAKELGRRITRHLRGLLGNRQ